MKHSSIYQFGQLYYTHLLQLCPTMITATNSLLLLVQIARMATAKIGILYIEIEQIKGINVVQYGQYNHVKIDHQSLNTIDQTKSGHIDHKNIERSLPRIDMLFNQYDIPPMIIVQLPIIDSSNNSMAMKPKYKPTYIYFHIVPIYHSFFNNYMAHQTLCMYLLTSIQHIPNKNIANCLSCNGVEQSATLSQLQKSPSQFNYIIQACLELNHNHARIQQLVQQAKIESSIQQRASIFGYLFTFFIKIGFVIILIIILAIRYKLKNKNQIQPI